MSIKWKFQMIMGVILLMTINLSATNYYVRKSGNDSNSGTSPSSAWLTISKACNASLAAGDTVFIGAGDYSERMIPSKSGSSGKPIVFWGDVTGERTGDPGTISIGKVSNCCAIDGKNYIELRFLTFHNASLRGVYINNTIDIRVSDCNFSSNKKYGIYSSGAGGNLTITNNYLDGGGTANIGILNSSSNIHLNIKNNEMINGGDGIYLYQTYVDSVANNTIHEINNNGIYMNLVYGCKSIYKNKINNIYGYYGIYASSSKCDNIDSNLLYNIQYYGIYVLGNSTINDTTSGPITNNELYNVYGDYGIFLKYINVGRVSNNNIHNVSKHGIYITDNAYTFGAVDSNLVHDTWGDGISINNIKKVNSISHNIIYSVNIGLHWYNTGSSTVNNFSRNTIHYCQTGGILIQNLENSTICNNLIYGNQSSNCYGIRIEANNNKTLHLVNNTVYKAGNYGIYGKDVIGKWRNNIVVGNNTYGIWGEGNFNVTDSYNCVYNNPTNWYGVAPGTGSFSSDPLFVDPDGADNTLGGANWQDDDLHIKCTGASWHFGLWRYDDADSPCLDTGDPADDYSKEPEDNGDRINIGCYGNTEQASHNCPITKTYPNFPNLEWVLIGIPLIPEDGDPQLIYGDDFGGEIPNGQNWMVIRWTTADSVSEYYEYGDGTIYQPPDCYPGIGHFVWQATGAPVDVDVSGRLLSKYDTLDVAAAPSVEWAVPSHPPGFNMFANPYTYKIDWSNSRILKYQSEFSYTTYTLNEAATQGFISRYAYIWNHTADQYEIITPDATKTDDSLSVWQGFWFVQLDSTSNLKLVIPAIRSLGKVSSISAELANAMPKYNYQTASVADEWDWFLKIGVVSKNGDFQDICNGIGISKDASDGFDAWDALDFRGTNVYGNFIQLLFRNEDERTLAYDIHAPFEEPSSWEFKVTGDSKNVGNKFYLVWPEIRLVPESVRFTLYNSDKSKVLIPDLRAASAPYYEFTLSKNDNYFNIEAVNVPDYTAPKFSFIVTQNSYVPRDATIYIIPSEPVSGISVRANGTPVSTREIQSPPYLYYYKAQLSGDSGILSLSVTATDFAGNSGSDSVNVNYIVAKKTSATTLVDAQSRIELNVPKNSLTQDIPLVFYCTDMDLDYPRGLTPSGKPVFIGPDGVHFSQPASIKIPVYESQVELYRYDGKTWEYVSDFSPKMDITASGTYQLFKKTSPETSSEPVPERFQLYQAYPNPFNNSTMIRYDLEKAGKVSLYIYDLLGNEVRSWTQNHPIPGTYSIKWDGKNSAGQLVASGTYIIRINVQKGQKTLYRHEQKITLIK